MIMIRHLGESYQEDIQPRCCMDGEIRSMTGNIESEWRKIGGGRRKIHSPDIVEICS